MYAILGAMDCEIDYFLEGSSHVQTTSSPPFTFHQGEFAGKEVVILKTGIGKVMSAMTTQWVIDTFHPQGLIVTGVAGALKRKFEVGDIVISRDCLQHDLDARPLAFARREVPYSGYHIIEADSALLTAAAGYSSDHTQSKHTLYTGRILTGDQFITHSENPSHSYLVTELEGDVVEMEGASVALVAHCNNVPFILVRTISDRADGDAHVDFAKFAPIAAANSYALVRHILEGV